MRSIDNINFPLGWIKCIVIVTVTSMYTTAEMRGPEVSVKS